jgi:hypothetical protein
MKNEHISFHGINTHENLNGINWMSFKDNLPEAGQKIILKDAKEGTCGQIRFNADFDFTVEELAIYSWFPVYS